MSFNSVRYSEDFVLRSLIGAQLAVTRGAESIQQKNEALAGESRVAWFAIVIPLVILAGLGIVAYLTVQCWNRGYSGFSGQWTMKSGWTSATIRFGCF